MANPFPHSVTLVVSNSCPISEAPLASCHHYRAITSIRMELLVCGVGERISVNTYTSHLIY